MWEEIKKIVLKEEEKVKSVQGEVVIKRSQELFGITGRKGCVGCLVSWV